jgi:hypothetical protein
VALDCALVMSSTKPPKSLRLNQKAQLVPAAQFAEWHRIASATAGMTTLDRQVLDAVATYYGLLRERGYASFLSIEMMAQSAQVRSIDITGAIRHLVELCLIAVRPGSGARRNEYLLALPKRAVAAMSVAAVEDDRPPF